MVAAGGARSEGRRRAVLEAVLAEVARARPVDRRRADRPRRGRAHRLERLEGHGRMTTMALEILWTRCRVVVAGRARRRRKLYDLPERALPDHHDAPRRGASTRWALLERVRGGGPARRAPAARAGRCCATCAPRPCPTPSSPRARSKRCAVEGSRRPYLAPRGLPRPPRRGDATAGCGSSARSIRSSGTARSSRQAFGFDYVWEVYKPASRAALGLVRLPAPAPGRAGRPHRGAGPRGRADRRAALARGAPRPRPRRPRRRPRAPRRSLRTPPSPPDPGSGDDLRHFRHFGPRRPGDDLRHFRHFGPRRPGDDLRHFRHFGSCSAPARRRAAPPTAPRARRAARRPAPPGCSTPPRPRPRPARPRAGGCRCPPSPRPPPPRRSRRTTPSRSRRRPPRRSGPPTGTPGPRWTRSCFADRSCRGRYARRGPTRGRVTPALHDTPVVHALHPRVHRLHRRRHDADHSAAGVACTHHLRPRAEGITRSRRSGSSGPPRGPSAARSTARSRRAPRTRSPARAAARSQRARRRR